MSTHTGEKTFQCVNCAAKFRGKNELDEHSKLHAGHSGVKSSKLSSCDAKSGGENVIVTLAPI